MADTRFDDVAYTTVTDDQIDVLRDLADPKNTGLLIANKVMKSQVYNKVVVQLELEGLAVRWPQPALTDKGEMIVEKLKLKDKPTLGKGPLMFKPLDDDVAPDVEDDGEITLHPQIITSRTVRFDKAMETLTADRGKVYGPPSEDFARINALKLGVASCDNDAVRHALEMICVKMARLCQTPDHYDSALDIAGYARTIMMVLDEQETTDA